MSRDATAPSRRARDWPRSWLPATLDPAQILVFSFAAVIATGTLLLMLPAASTSGTSLRFVDAFFTIVSATCVTGLAVVDTGSAFTTFGQLVILVCIQIGGLGFMTFTTVFLVALGKRLTIADRVLIQESFHHSPTGKLSTLIVYIFSATALTELVGTLLLTKRWLEQGLYTEFGDAFYSAAFHAISAFCNAGFSLFPDNLMRFQRDAFTQLVISALIVVGGLGFLTGLDLKEYLQQRLFIRFWPQAARQRVERMRPRPRLSLHTKFAVVTTAVLLLIGTVSFYVLERNGVLAGMSAATAWLNAWFCSVTPRTAGFNTVDYGQMSGPALLCTIVLMFIGGSPGSAAGGVKTTTFGLLLIYALFRWRGHESPHAFNRSIPQATLERATAVIVLAVGVIVLAVSALLAAEGRAGTAAESQARFLPLLFEGFSSFGTVGLSMGITPQLTDAGKLILCGLMFVGRIGPATVAMAVGTRKVQAKFRYAEENVMVG